MNFFSHDNIFFVFLNYPLSYLEFVGVVTGGIAVWLAGKANILSWPIGIVNVTLFFFLFFQVQLYPDMFLQVFFFVTNLIGWWRWANPKDYEADKKDELRVSWMAPKWLIFMIILVLFGTIGFGLLASQLHELFPKIFSLPSAFPYVDSFVLSTSIVATYLLVQKKIECWLAWIATDIVATCLYFSKDIMFVSLEYFAFTCFAIFGFWRWRKELMSYEHNEQG